MQAQVIQTEHVKDGQYIELYSIKNSNGFEIKLTNYGCTLMNILWPIENQKSIDILLGYDTVDKYIDDKNWFGATAGRCCNRIRDARCTIDGIEYNLSANIPPHHLHGGAIGFDKRTWRGHIEQQDQYTGVKMFLLSRDGDQGYPGNLSVTAFVGLNENNEIVIDYKAETDKTTICNITSHAYFDLSGSGDILDHELMLLADKITHADDEIVTTGAYIPVAHTAFDFNQETSIRKNMALGHEQITKANGFDQNFCLIDHGANDIVCSAKDPISGRRILISTNQRGVQFYSGNHLHTIGKEGKLYNKHAGFCLETQAYPNAINIDSFPSVLLHPGEKYHSWTKIKMEH